MRTKIRIYISSHLELLTHSKSLKVSQGSAQRFLESPNVFHSIIEGRGGTTRKNFKESPLECSYESL